jgi:flagellar protein FlbT
MQITLKAGERIYLNGAVVRVDRKVTIELLNDVTFLLEGHVLQIEETKTPLRQIYFVVQMMLMDPKNGPRLRELASELVASARESFRSGGIPTALEDITSLLDEGRAFEVLRTLRALFPVEDKIMDGTVAEPGDGTRGARLRAVMNGEPPDAGMPAAAGG